jgi:hypothetical protein
MGDLLAERFLIDASHGLHIVDAHLTPGQTVEVIIRMIDTPAQPKQSFLKTAQHLQMATPTDYSVSFEQALRTA